MFRRSVLPRTLSCSVRSRCTPRSRKRVTSARCTIVRPDLGLHVVADDREPACLEAAVPVALAREEDGMQFTIAQPTLRICSAYHLVACSERHREVVDDHIRAPSCRRTAR
jgi:hypothetical protein